MSHYETYADARSFYLVMEHVDGVDLLDKIGDREEFTESMAASLMKKLFSALQHMHDQGVLHLDLRPENIMLTAEGDKDGNPEPRIIDFDLSKKLTEGKPLMCVKGEPHYMAPELFLGKYSTKSDTWSLGVLLYVLISGYCPFDSDQRNQLLYKIK